MINKFTKEILAESGLIEAGISEDGNQLYLGTDAQWRIANEYQEREDFGDLKEHEKKEESYANKLS